MIASRGSIEAKKVILNELNSDPNINQADVSENSDSIWFEYKDGTLGTISPNMSEHRNYRQGAGPYTKDKFLKKYFTVIY